MENSKEHSNKGNYKTFFIMLACSFVAMYITMYLNTYSIDHVWFSLTRFYMTCLGISTMAVIMWFFMRKMYNDKKKNIAILAGSFILFVGRPPEGQSGSNCPTLRVQGCGDKGARALLVWDHEL